MYIRKNWFPLTVFIVAIVGVGFYYLQTRSPEKDPIMIIKPVEVEKPKAEVNEGDTSQGGHFHEDGTWHPGSHADHEAHSRDASTQPASPDAPTETSGTHAEGGQGSTVEGVQAPVKLDPETQKKVDALYKQADALSEEAGVWSDKLYARVQENRKTREALRVEKKKVREMRSDPNVEKATYTAFQNAVDAKARALKSDTIWLNDQYIQNRERWEGAMRLRAEARRLQGLK